MLCENTCVSVIVIMYSISFLIVCEACIYLLLWGIGMFTIAGNKYFSFVRIGVNSCGAYLCLFLWGKNLFHHMCVFFCGA